MKETFTQVLQSDPKFPKLLLHIDTCPERLFIKGKILKKDSFAIAIVGSRQMSEFGKKKAWEYSSFLAKSGVTIVSGLARGIDTVVHKAALSEGGRTIAVLGSGIDVVYPSENKDLVQKIIKSGAVVTEFAPATKPFPQNFLARNRLISGISLAVLVIEGASRSGALSTATWAANQNREVFVIPTPKGSTNSYLPNYLIENGATKVNTPMDILNHIIDIDRGMY